MRKKWITLLLALLLLLTAGCGGTNDSSNTTGQEQNETNTVPPQEPEQPPTQPEEPAEPEEPEPDPRQETIDSILSGMTLEEYAAYESGTKDFSFSHLFNIAETLGVDISDLLTGESPKLRGYVLTRSGQGLAFDHGEILLTALLRLR